ncbi:MAG: SPOR domain-containing protein [Gammaproteobacteria bacterium]|nr:SPOR domain-containing protein [Gammaproteobacteria bacterium]
MTDFRKKLAIAAIWACLWSAFPAGVLAASYEFAAIETLYGKTPQALTIQPHAIVISSSRQRFDNLPQNTRNSLKDYFTYQARVKVNQTTYYRLVVGNYQNLNHARADLKKLKPTFPNAWIYRRSNAERQGLDEFLRQPDRKRKAELEPVVAETTEDLLARAKQYFLDENYAPVIEITDRIILTGNLDQARAALELAGTVRERQGKYSRAVDLYETLLDTSPPSELKARILDRLQGIRTMGLQPKARLQSPQKNPDDKNWIVRGALQQYYRDDVIDRPGEDSVEVNEVLVSDVDLQIQRRTDADVLSIEVDAGLVADLINDDTDSRISRASLSYARDDFRIIGGRQQRTVKGVQGRFDGITFSDLSSPAYQVSYFLGTLAQSSFDNLQSDNPLIGANIDFSPYDWFDVNLYLINQEISGLTDRQAIGSEFQLRSDSGFIYGIIDYDVFYEDLNNATFISNYRYDPRLSFNLTLSQVNTPTLTTANALQGQAISSIDELEKVYTEDEIYQLAQDRTSKSNSLYFGVYYVIDNRRQVNVDFSVFDMDATTASAGVAAIPSTRDLQLSLDYSVSGLFSASDYTSMGFRLSDSDTSEILSLRMRSRFAGSGGFSYQPKVQLDFRQSKNSGPDQTILKPSIRLKYQVTRSLHLESDFSLEHSDLDLPDFDRQTAYSLFLGYIYFF